MERRGSKPDPERPLIIVTLQDMKLENEDESQRKGQELLSASKQTQSFRPKRPLTGTTRLRANLQTRRYARQNFVQMKEEDDA